MVIADKSICKSLKTRGCTALVQNQESHLIGSYFLLSRKTGRYESQTSIQEWVMNDLIFVYQKRNVISSSKTISYRHSQRRIIQNIFTHFSTLAKLAVHMSSNWIWVVHTECSKFNSVLHEPWYIHLPYLIHATFNTTPQQPWTPFEDKSPQRAYPQQPAAAASFPLSFVMLKVVISSAVVGWIPTVSMISSNLQPSFMAVPNPCITSPAFGPK